MEKFTLEKQLELAINLAIKHHANQKDKAGMPYILHPLWVMSNVKDIKSKVVAVLHDIIEDTTITEYDLKMHGLNDEIVYAIKVLTKVNGESYTEYLKRVKNNELARAVKLVDLEHNMDLDRLIEITDKDKERLVKYKNAYKFLLCSK